MGKAPSFQYYPDDWRADAVSGCSLAARGLWHEMMNMMHGTERYGYLVANRQPIPDATIARYCGCSLAEYHVLLGELDSAGVPRRTQEGIIFCSRMVKDQKKRDKWRKDKENQRVKSNSCPPNVREMSTDCPPDLLSSSSKLKPKTHTFTPPTELEVAAYMTARGIQDAFREAEKFVAHHAQRHWKVSGGKGPLMSDWKKAVVTWQGSMSQFARQNGPKTAAEKNHDTTARALSRVFSDVVGDVSPDLPPTDRGTGGNGVPGGPQRLLGCADRQGVQRGNQALRFHPEAGGDYPVH